jgi:N6-adenosine-specific RNA methylase IME4
VGRAKGASPAGARAPSEARKTAVTFGKRPSSKLLSKRTQFHPLADLFPLLEGADFEELVADVRAHGVREPIWLHQGKILDGRNRYRAAAEAHVPCPTRIYDGDDPVGFVVSLNLKRRHLNESQRAMVAAKLATMKRGDNQHSPIGETSQARAAELLNVGKRSVERAHDVREGGAPELVRAVERGDVSVSAAADVATMPPDEQREIVARGEGEILKVASQIRARKLEDRRAERLARIAAQADAGPLPQDRKYPVLLADPPYRYVFSQTSSRAIERHYETMTLEEICAMPVSEIATPSAVLFLFVPSPILEQAFAIIRAWGFTYTTAGVWKKTDGFGEGHYFRQQHEHLLVAKRGDIPPPPPHLRSSSVFEAPRPEREHSRKPDEAYALIERMYPELPKIELFARKARPGWSCWGNEVEAVA